ncbi:peptide ABC transporter substrate-binding protein [Phenylobacterium sp.]|uniref:peptide ABC transporter substrate-binding protein n=1 Tax=Phenylobacterium sp. TaxID=1871053 RepID=UPI002DEE7841|nr:peptide ABC transporter substrate-binding protein [Phenylobacterium sp.]
MRRYLIALVPALSALMLAGCQDKPHRPACPAGAQCFEFGLDAEPATLDPHRANLVEEAWVIGDLMEGLTTEAADGSPIAGGATAWETSPDGLVWTFHLRHGARWSDGTPVTADDYVYGLQRVLDPKIASIYAYLVYVIKGGAAVSEGRAPASSLGARALDPYTLQLTLEHPAPYLLELTKHQSFYPVPRHVVERYGDNWVAPGHYVSNGPFKLVSWRLGDHIEITKNPQFHDAAHVCLDRVDYFQTPDAISGERRVQSGELDATNTFQSNRIDRLKTVMPRYVHTHTALATSYLSLNTRGVKPFQDLRVRRALSEAVDREFMTAKLMRAGQQPAYAFVPPGTANYPFGVGLRWAAEPFAQRQIEARALLAQAGFTAAHPLKIEIKTTTNSESLLLTEAIQADWRAVGVEVSIVQNDGPVAFAAYADRDYQVGYMAWYADFNDPLTFLGLLKSDTGAQNYGDYKNPAYDALLAAADKEPDAARRGQILARAEQTMLDDAAMIPVAYTVTRALVNPRVSGWVDNPENFHRSRWLCMGPGR